MSISSLIRFQIFEKETLLRYLDIDSIIRLRWTSSSFFRHLDWVTISKLFPAVNIPKSIPHGLTRMQWCLGLLRNDDMVSSFEGYDDSGSPMWDYQGTTFDSRIVCIHEDGVFFDFDGWDNGLQKPKIFESAYNYYKSRCPFTKGKFHGFTQPRNSRHIIQSAHCGRYDNKSIFAPMNNLKIRSAMTVHSEMELASELYVESRGFEHIQYSLKLIQPERYKFNLVMVIHNMAYYAN